MVDETQKYQPTEKEIQSAEEMMSEEQKQASTEREDEILYSGYKTMFGDDRSSARQLVKIKKLMENGGISVETKTTQNILRDLTTVEKAREDDLEKDRAILFDKMMKGSAERAPALAETVLGIDLGISKKDITERLSKINDRIELHKDLVSKLESGDKEAAIETLQQRLSENLTVVKILKNEIGQMKYKGNEKSSWGTSQQECEEKLIEVQKKSAQLLRDLEVLKG